jgi:hypothetical protein
MLYRVVAGLVVAGLFAPCAGRAWTRAHVREVHARLDLEETGQTQVRLELVVDVRGGWLERLELPGLDEGLRLSSEPVSVLRESGGPAAGQALVEAGVLTLRFARSDGLRRGIHRLRVQYTADLAGRAQPQRSGFSRLSWTLPGWEAALAAAEIVVTGPMALRAVPDPEGAAEVAGSVEEGRRVLRFARVHVPRASPWQVTLELPTALLAPNGARASSSVRQAEAAPGRWRTGLLLGGAIGLLAVFGRRRTRAHLAALGRPARTLLAPVHLASWALGGMSLLSGAAWHWSPGAALGGWLLLIALSQETAAPPCAIALGRFEPLRARQLRNLARARARERIGLPWVDPASWLGLVFMLGCAAALALHAGSFALAGDPWGLGLVCALLGFAATSRLWQPRSTPEQVELLVQAAAKMQAVGCALSLLWYVAGEACGQPRLRILPRARYAGLLRIELLVDTRRSAPALVLNVLVEVDSPAARWTHALWPDALCECSKGGARLAFLRPISEVSAEIEGLLGHFTRESQRVFESKGQQERAA